MKRTVNTEKNSRLAMLIRAAIVLLVVLVFVSTARGLVHLSSSGSKVREAENKLESARLEQERLKEELSLVESDFYREKETRDKLGLAKEGEIVVILPDENVLRRLSPRKPEPVNIYENEPNWKSWARLFFEI